MRGNEKEFKETRLIIVLLSVIIILLLGVIILFLAKDNKQSTILEPNKVEKKEEKTLDKKEESEKEETKDNIENNNDYSMIDLSKECFNKNESCEKNFKLNFKENNNTINIKYKNEHGGEIIISVDNKEVINSPYGYRINKIYLLDNGMLVFEAPPKDDNFITYEYYSKELNHVITLSNKEVLNNNFKTAKSKEYTYKLLDDNTFEIETKDKSMTKLNGNEKSSKISFDETECINLKKECKKEYTLSNGSKEITVKTTVNEKDYDELNNEYSYSKRIYINNELLGEFIDASGYYNIKEIALLDNNLIVVEYEGYNHPANFGGKTYYQEDLSILLNIHDTRFVGGHLEGDILSTNQKLYAAEDGCNIDGTNRVIHIYDYKIISNNKYQVSGVDTKNTRTCAGQS